MIRGSIIRHINSEPLSVVHYQETDTRFRNWCRAYAFHARSWAL